MAEINSSLETELIKYFVTLKEDEFSKTILKPLFERMGYFPVNFYGGRDEGGKDLICWKKDEFDDKNLTVIQVKKTNPSASASKSESFAGIVNQLQQAKEKKVADLDGIERLPDFVFFITPYQIDIRALESRFEGMSNSRLNGIKVYDGCHIANQVIKRIPEIIPAHLNNHFNLINSVESNSLSNAPLLSSLQYKNNKDYKSFYVNLDFGVGKINSNVFLEWTFSPKVKSLNLPSSEFLFFKEKIRYYENYFGVTCVKPNWEDLEDNYLQKLAACNSKGNKATLAKLEKLKLDLEDLIEDIKQILPSIIASLALRFKVDLHQSDNNFADKGIKEAHLKLNNLFDGISVQSNYASSVEYIINNEADIKDLINSISEIYNNEADKVDKNELKQISTLEASLEQTSIVNQQVKNLSKNVISEPDYQFEIDCLALANQLTLKQAELKDVLKSFENSEFDKPKLRGVLIEFSELFKNLDGLVAEKQLYEALRPTQIQSDAKSVDSLRNKVKIFDIFKTGISVAILGDAGAGKSTTLEMYARQQHLENEKNRCTLYLPLTKIIDPNKKVDSNFFEMLESGILNYLNLNQKNPLSISQLREEIRKYPDSTFIFDGVDEVIKSSDWILSAINLFADYYSKSQIIISSRLGGNYLSEIRFLTITVLPFTDEQLLDFVSGWFAENPEKISPIIKHLQLNRSVGDVVRNPLLATILCILAENNVPLPTKEISLYRERTKLLFGHYDIHKNAKRVESHHELLEDVARKIAFKLHSSTKRMETKDTLKIMAVNALGFSSYTKEQIGIAVEELITACNVLVEMSANEEYGFGHLRFQEHLAAEEIVRNRGVDVGPLLKSSWWRSVMVLFSQMTDNLASIIDDQIKQDAGLGATTETIQAMLNVKTPNESKKLQSLIDQYRAIDNFEELDYWDSRE